MHHCVKNISKKTKRLPAGRHPVRANDGTCVRKTASSTQPVGEIILGSVACKVDRKAVLEASLIRNRAVLDELSKH